MDIVLNKNLYQKRLSFNVLYFYIGSTITAQFLLTQFNIGFINDN